MKLAHHVLSSTVNSIGQQVSLRAPRDSQPAIPLCNLDNCSAEFNILQSRILYYIVLSYSIDCQADFPAGLECDDCVQIKKYVVIYP